MYLLPSALHSVVDYVLATVLVTVPLVAGWPAGSPESMVLIIVGVSIFVYSLFTHYRPGRAGISMEVHLGLDLLGAVLLVASPWLFGFADTTNLLHVGLGLSQFTISVISQGTPRGERIKEL